MTALEVFGWLMGLASLLTVAVWVTVAIFVLQGAYELCRDLWQWWREKP